MLLSIILSDFARIKRILSLFEQNIGGPYEQVRASPRILRRASPAMDEAPEVALMPSFRGHPFLETRSVSPVFAYRIEGTLGKCIESGSDPILGQSVLPLRADPPKISLSRDGLEDPLRPEGKGTMLLPLEKRRTRVHEDFHNGRNRLHWKTVG